MAASETICISRVTDRLSIQPAIRQGDEADEGTGDSTAAHADRQER